MARRCSRYSMALAAAAAMAAGPACKKEEAAATPAPPTAAAERSPLPAKSPAQARMSKLLAEQLGVPPAKLTASARLKEDLGADSLDCVEIVMALEEEFDLEIPDADVERFETVGDLVRYAEAHQRR